MSDIAALRRELSALADSWDQAEQAADDYGPSAAYTGRDCAEMLREAIA